MSTSTRSVYVHAPFCARRCFYCDFAVTVDADPGHASWLASVRSEWDQVKAEGVFVLDDPLETLYVGGGTPSLLGPGAMEGLAAFLGSDLMSDPGLEWTAEANPESLTPELAEAWRAAGVNRLSVGVQSFDEATLRWMGRTHGPEGPPRAIQAARAAGFDNLSVDLIFGLPDHLTRDWTEDLERALQLGPEHVSLYGLTVEARTPLGRSVSEGNETAAPEERYRSEYLEAVETLTSSGYEHYEVSSFGHAGAFSRHNAVYWSGKPYLGLGNGAHSHIGTVRRWNLRDWAEYSTTVAQGRLPLEGQEELDPQARRLEEIWLRLRTREGLPHRALSGVAPDLFEHWIECGWAKTTPKGICLTAEGWLVMDALAVELDGELVRAVPAE